MNKGTKIRTALRIAFSIYTTFCMWQVSIGELSKQINAPWLIIACAVVIVVSGLVVDALTTYFNNDFTEEACQGTGITRQLKAQKKNDYIGDVIVPEDEEVVEEENDEQNDL